MFKKWHYLFCNTKYAGNLAAKTIKSKLSLHTNI